MPARRARARGPEDRARWSRPTKPAATPRSWCRSTTSTPGAASARPTARSRSGGSSRRTRCRASSCGRGTCSRCARARAACSSGAATPRPPSTSWCSWRLPPVAVTCEVLAEDGSPARLECLREFAERPSHRDGVGRAGGAVPRWRTPPRTTQPHRRHPAPLAPVRGAFLRSACGPQKRTSDSELDRSQRLDRGGVAVEGDHGRVASAGEVERRTRRSRRASPRSGCPARRMIISSGRSSASPHGLIRRVPNFPVRLMTPARIAAVSGSSGRGASPLARRASS